MIDKKLAGGEVRSELRERVTVDGEMAVNGFETTLSCDRIHCKQAILRKLKPVILISMKSARNTSSSFSLCLFLENMKEKMKMGERERERYGTLYNADDDDDDDDE